MAFKLIKQYQQQNIINPILKYVHTVHMRMSRPIILQFRIVENTLILNSIQIMLNLVT